MIVYFDSSAFVTLLIDEDDCELAAALWDGSDIAVSSRLSYPQVCATLAAAGRAHRLSRAGQRRAEEAWEDYWAATRAVELSPEVSVNAGRLASQHSLRGVDAVHLSSALVVGAGHVIFAVWDQRLRSGARAVNLQVAPRV